MRNPENNINNPGNNDYWHLTGELYLRQNGIDLCISTRFPSFKYEDYAFSSLLSRIGNGFALGPHLIDDVLGSNAGFQFEIRPDAFIFKQDKDEWVMTSLVEFKSGANNGFHKKIHGFSHLLESLRSRPDFLVSSLNDTVGEYITVPQKVLIPHDKQIQVTFVGPFPGGVYFDDNTEFSVTFLKLNAVE